MDNIMDPNDNDTSIIDIKNIYKTIMGISGDETIMKMTTFKFVYFQVILSFLLTFANFYI